MTDLLIAKSVEYCAQNGIQHLQYGSWSKGSLGAFKEKHGFQRIDVPRYFVPLNIRGRVMLKLGLHRPMKDRLPDSWIDWLISIRTRWYNFKASVGNLVKQIRGCSI